MAEAMLPKECLVVMLAPDMFCQMTLQHDGIAVQLRIEQQEEHNIRPALWEAFFKKITLLQDIQRCIQPSTKELMHFPLDRITPMSQ